MARQIYSVEIEDLRTHIDLAVERQARADGFVDGDPLKVRVHPLLQIALANITLNKEAAVTFWADAGLPVGQEGA